MTLKNKVISSALSLSFLMPLALPVMAKTGAPAAQVDVACVKAAVEKRETAIEAASDAYNTSVKAARLARKTAELAAWDLTDRKARKAAMTAAARGFREAVKTARNTLRTARQGAWKEYKKDLQACGARGGDEGGLNQSLDEQS